MIFRKCKSVDFPQILTFLKLAATKLQLKKVDQWKQWLSPAEEDIYWVNEGVENDEFFFVEIENQLVAMFRLSKEDELYWGKQSEDARYIHSLVVHPEHSGKRIGHQVIRKVIQELKQDNIPYLRLDCVANNEKLCNYYEQQGFKKAGKREIKNFTYKLFELKL